MLHEARPVEQEMTAREVGLHLQALLRQPEETFVVVEAECSLVPRQDAVTDLVGVCEPRSGLGLGQVHERRACREHERTEDPLPYSWFLRRYVWGEVPDVHDGVEAHRLGKHVEGSGDVAKEARFPQGPLGGGQDLPPDQLVEFIGAQGVVPS
jgi:hypothetical protein